MGRRSRMVRCKAKSKRSGEQCRSYAVDGAYTCRMHGGTHPKGAAAPQSKINRKHGLYANTLTDQQRAEFERMFTAALEDPTIGMVADAVFLRLKAAAAAEKAAADPNGMVIVKQSATKQTTPGPNGEKRIVETAHIEKVDVTQPVSDLLVKAGRLASEAVLVRKKAGITTEGDAALTEAQAAQILADEFGDTGALRREDEDANEQEPVPDPEALP